MRRSRTLAAVAALLAVSAPLAATSTAGAADGPTGSAFAVSVDMTLLGTPAVRVDPIPFVSYPQGGSDSVVDIGPRTLGSITGGVLNASSTTSGDVLTSRASLADVVVKDVLKISDVLSATAVEAQCAAGPGSLSGSSSVVDLKVLGVDVDVNAAPGTEINVLDVAKVRINEQIREGDTITVNAVRVIVDGALAGVTTADIVLAQAKCSAASDDTGTTSPTPTSSTEPSTPGTPTSTTEPGTPTGTSGPSGPREVPPTDAPSDGTPPGVVPVANSGDLADTGVSTIVPLILGGGVLVGAGVFLMLRNRRSRSAGGSSND